MEARFFCETGALAGADYRIGGSATIGRGSSNTIVVADGVVSKTHARISFDAAAASWFLEDLGSTNGTRLDGAPVSGRTRLRDLHVVTLGGRHDFIFVVPAGDAVPAAAFAASDSRPEGLARSAGKRAVAGGESPPVIPGPAGETDDGAAAPATHRSDAGAPASSTRYEPASALSVPPLVAGDDSAAAGAGDSPSEGAGSRGASASSGGRSSASGTRYEPASALSVPPLVAGSGPAADEAAPPAGVSFDVQIAGGEPRRIRLGDGRHVLGRVQGCDVPIDDRTLSRRHAAFVVRGGRVAVEDLDSLNGTFVDGTRVGEETEVGPGGVVGLGEAVTVIRVGS